MEPSFVNGAKPGNSGQFVVQCSEAYIYRETHERPKSCKHDSEYDSGQGCVISTPDRDSHHEQDYKGGDIVTEMNLLAAIEQARRNKEPGAKGCRANLSHNPFPP